MRHFGLTSGTAFLALAALGAWRGRGIVAAVAGAFGTLLLAAAAIAPMRLAAVERRWMVLAHAMSRVTTPLFMGVVYFGVVTPLGLALRVVRRRDRARDAGTFLVRRAPGTRRSDLRRQF